MTHRDSPDSRNREGGLVLGFAKRLNVNIRDSAAACRSVLHTVSVSMWLQYVAAAAEEVFHPLPAHVAAILLLFFPFSDCALNFSLCMFRL